MTATPPARPLLRSLPLFGAGVLLAASACGVLDSGGGTATMPADWRRSDQAPTRPGEVTYSDNPDGTTTVRLGPQSPSLRFGLTWHYEGPIVVGPDPAPEMMPNHATVAAVLPGSAAERAGLVPGDTILSVNGRDGRMGGLFPGRNTTGGTYVMRLRRGGVERETTLVVAPPEPGTDGSR